MNEHKRFLNEVIAIKMVKVIPNQQECQKQESIRWMDFGDRLFKSVEFQIGNTVVQKSVCCKKCEIMFEAPVTDWEKEWEKILRGTDLPDFELCTNCDNKVSNKAEEKCDKKINEDTRGPKEC